MPDPVVIEQLATADREIVSLRHQLARALKMLAELEARCYTLEVEGGSRKPGEFGLDRLRFAGGMSFAGLEGRRKQVLDRLLDGDGKP